MPRPRNLALRADGFLATNIGGGGSRPNPRRRGCRRALDVLPPSWCFAPHEHRRPQNPTLVAHLLRGGRCDFIFPIVRGRQRSATALSFVLCGVPSASFVRGSHEQDGFFTSGEIRIPHPWRAGGHAVGGAILRRRQPARRSDRTARPPP